MAVLSLAATDYAGETHQLHAHALVPVGVVGLGHVSLPSTGGKAVVGKETEA
jgi:hypothetical protein